MNILFVLKSLNIGGLEVVTAVLANKFVQEGHNVSVFAFETLSGKLIERFSEKIKYKIGYGFKNNKENIIALRDIIIEENIHVIINQWGLPLIPINVIKSAKKGKNIKVISVYHNDPLKNGRVQNVDKEIALTKNIPKRIFLSFKRYCYRCITGYSMRYIYYHSDVFEVLSPSYIEHFKRFTKLRNVKKLVVQTNPVTLSSEGYTYNHLLKNKEIVYVGRLDYTQKRVYRVIDTWGLIENQFPDWSLRIIGDGAERENIYQKAKDLGVKRISFEGYQQPRPYYEHASILILTSDYEGFPLVLAECMSFGVVPVVYGSYPAVYDIIEDGKDGAIIEKNSNGFNAAVMAERLACLMRDDIIRNKMALSAISKSRVFSIENIYRQWVSILEKS